MNSNLTWRSSATATLQSGRSSLITFVAVLWAMHSACDAASVFQPAGLKQGDQYRVAFITSGTIVPSTTDLSVYNSFATTEAGLAGSLVRGLMTSWTSIVSNSVTSALTNTDTDPTPAGPTGVPIYLVDGATRIANNYDDLWDGTIAAPLGLTQFSTAPTGGLIDYMAWTGTNEDGTSSALFSMGTSSIIGGFATETSRFWVASSLIGVGPELHYADHLYALSGVLTAVPEPASGVSLAAALLCFGACRRRWRR
jgi:hypothetical protein